MINIKKILPWVLDQAFILVNTKLLRKYEKLRSLHEVTKAYSLAYKRKAVKRKIEQSLYVSIKYSNFWVICTIWPFTITTIKQVTVKEKESERDLHVLFLKCRKKVENLILEIQLQKLVTRFSQLVFFLQMKNWSIYAHWNTSAALWRNDEANLLTQIN